MHIHRTYGGFDTTIPIGSNPPDSTRITFSPLPMNAVISAPGQPSKDFESGEIMCFGGILVILCIPVMPPGAILVAYMLYRYIKEIRCSGVGPSSWFWRRAMIITFLISFFFGGSLAITLLIILIKPNR